MASDERGLEREAGDGVRGGGLMAGLRLLTVVGARPQFVKAAALCRALRGRGAVEQRLLHTGQHYDDGMSGAFFRELEIQEPHWNLGVGSAPHAAQTAAMITGIDRVLLEWPPDAIVVVGDTNSTLAGALAAAKRLVPIVHVEAGLRSYNREMPEEINRCVSDHLSAFLFCPTETAVRNLAREGIERGVHRTGDVMLDCALHQIARLPDLDAWLTGRGLARGRYALATIHRAENTDSPVRLGEIVEGLRRVSRRLPVVWPLHPRTRKRLDAEGLAVDLLTVLDPSPYGEMLQLERGAAVVLTDSGGVQKEAYFFGVPCVTLRTETEWVETVEAGWNRVVPGGPSEIEAGALQAMGVPVPGPRPDLFGDGTSAEAMADILLRGIAPASKV